jgi:hypothetical protein
VNNSPEFNVTRIKPMENTKPDRMLLIDVGRSKSALTTDIKMHPKEI